MQNILADVFASISIYFDKPFKRGDLVDIGNDRGVIEYVGIKSTRIKTPSGEELIIGNKELLASRIRNYSSISRRRNTIQFYTPYSTTPQQIEKAIAIIKEIVSSQEKAELLRCCLVKMGTYHVSFFVLFLTSM